MFPPIQFQTRPSGLKLRLLILYSPHIQFYQKHQVSIWSDFAERALRLRAGGDMAVLPKYLHILTGERCGFSQISRQGSAPQIFRPERERCSFSQQPRHRPAAAAQNRSKLSSGTTWWASFKCSLFSHPNSTGVMSSSPFCCIGSSLLDCFTFP